MNVKLIVAVLIAALVVAGAALAKPGGDDAPRRMGKVVIGALDSIDAAGGTAVIVVEKYLVRGQGEVPGNGEKFTVAFHEKTRFGKNGEKSELSAFKIGDSVVAVVVEKDGKQYAIAMSDPETARKFKEKMHGWQDGRKMRDKDGKGWKDGPRSGMDKGREGFGPRGDRRNGRAPMMMHGIPIFGEVTKIDKDFITVKVEPLPFEELGFERPEHRPGFFGADGGERKHPDTVKVKTSDKTQVFIGGSESKLSDVKVGAKFMFRCAPPEGEWSRDNHPEFLIANRIADIETIKKHMAERPMMGEGRRGPH